MPHITDYRITLLVGAVVMALTFYAFRLLEGWLTSRAQQSDSSTRE